MGNHAIGRTQLLDRDAPRRGGRQQQALARLRAGKLKIIAAVLHGRRRIGSHTTIKTVRNTLDAGPASLAELGLAAAERIGGALAHDLERPLWRHLAAVAVG